MNDHQTNLQTIENAAVELKTRPGVRHRQKLVAEMAFRSILVLRDVAEELNGSGGVDSPVSQGGATKEAPGSVQPFISFDYDDSQSASTRRSSVPTPASKPMTPITVGSLLTDGAAILASVLSTLINGLEVPAFSDSALLELSRQLADYARRRLPSVTAEAKSRDESVNALAAVVEQLRGSEKRESELLEEKQRFEQQAKQRESKTAELAAEIVALEKTCADLAEREAGAMEQVTQLQNKQTELESVAAEQQRLGESIAVLEQKIAESKPKQAELKEAANRLHELQQIASKLGDSRLLPKIQQIWQELPADEFDKVRGRG